MAMEAYERYMAGEPINAELAKVRDGLVDEPDAPVAAPVAAIRVVRGELRRADRQELKEAVRGEGWQVALRIRENLLQRLEKSAISLSQDNPLANRDRIAEAWAYKDMFQRAMKQWDLAIEAELVKLEQTDKVAVEGEAL